MHWDGRQTERRLLGRVRRARYDRVARGTIAGACAALALMVTPASAERLRLFQDENYTGYDAVFGTPQPDLRERPRMVLAGSAKVITGAWLICHEAFYGGSCAWISRDVKSFRHLAFEGPIGSLRPERVPVLQRQWGDRGPPPRTALVFFSEPDFQGDWVALRETVPDLDAAKIKIKPSSVVVGSGVWRICTQPNLRGACLSMTASAWDLAEVFHTDIRSIERLQ